MKASIGLIILLFVSCTKEQMTTYTAFLSNKSNHNIIIKPYYNGIVPQNKIISLAVNDSFQIAKGTDRGIVDNGGFDSDAFGGSDSIVVVFDNLYSITHYTTQPTLLASKYYLVNSNRNLRNKNSYIYSYQDPSKNRRKSNYLYKFVLQDYLDSQ